MTFMLVVSPGMQAVPVLARSDTGLLNALVRKPHQIVPRPLFTAYATQTDVGGSGIPSPQVNLLASALLFPEVVAGVVLFLGNEPVPQQLLDAVASVWHRVAEGNRT